MGNYADFWAGLGAEEKLSKATDERRASVGASIQAINKFAGFVMKGETQEERDLRLDLVDGDVRRLSEIFAEKHDVEVEPVLAFVKEKLAAEVAVTEPETIDPEEGIGEETEEGGEERFADALSDVNSLESVLEEDGLDKPVRHKKEKVDLNDDTAKKSSKTVAKVAYDVESLRENFDNDLELQSKCEELGIDPSVVEEYAQENGLDGWEALEELVMEKDAAKDSYDDYYDGPGNYELYGPDRPERQSKKKTSESWLDRTKENSDFQKEIGRSDAGSANEIDPYGAGWGDGYHGSNTFYDIISNPNTPQDWKDEYLRGFGLGKEQSHSDQKFNRSRGNRDY